MKASWLIEKDIFEDIEDRLIAEIKNQGLDVKFLTNVREDDVTNKAQKLYGPQDCVIFYGSLNLGRKLRKAPWIPGVYLNERAFECTSYYPVLADKLVHHNYIMMPFGDLIRRKNNLYEYFNSDKIFIRPNSGNKQFTGMIATKNDYEECVKLAAFYNVDPDLLVVVSNVMPLTKEWRFVVVNKEVISGSLYRDWTSNVVLLETKDYVLLHSNSVCKECEDSFAWMAARQAALRYNPDICYTIDIAQISIDNGFSYGILEVGSFSCAGLYGNDLHVVVEKVSEAALNEWKEYNE